MSTTLTIDNGNTNPHIGFFKGSTLTETTSFNDIETINKLLKKHSQSNNVVKAIISNVGDSKKLHEKLDRLDFKIESKFKKFLVEKASILINGVSLTIAKIKKNSFEIWVIPHTLKLTNLYYLKKNDLVNIEIDILSKYVKKFLNEKK